MAIIAVDFDGVLSDPTETVWPELGPEIPDAQYALLKLKRLRHKVVIYTSRAYDRTGTEIVMAWLDAHRIPYDGVTNIKPQGASWYIDDKAVRFDNWPHVLEQIL